MLRYRTFRNTDPPVLAALWQSRAQQPGLRQPVWPDLLEQLVFAKLYFDYQGLWLAWDNDRPMGFAHAGFGPNEVQTGLSTEQGVTCLVLVRGDCAAEEEAAVAAGLLERCEDYLRCRGASVFYGGATDRLAPFYLGLYSSSGLPGVLDSDKVARQAFETHGYEQIARAVVLQRELADFEAPVDRRQMQIRRQMVVQVTIDPRPRTWWEACLLAPFDLVRFELVPRGADTAVAGATFRNLDPTGAAGVSRQMGLIELAVEEHLRRRGLAVFLLSEACRQFQREGVARVEAQVMQDNLAAMGLFDKLGFRQTDQGGVYRKH